MHVLSKYSINFTDIISGFNKLRNNSMHAYYYCDFFTNIAPEIKLN